MHFPQKVPGNQQTIDTTLTYTPLTRLRLDFGWSAFNHREESGVVTNGIGTICNWRQDGGKERT